MPRAAIPLISHYNPRAPLVYRHGSVHGEADQPGPAIAQAGFLTAAMALADQLPNRRYAINLCRDRHHFLLSFAAALLRGMTNLLPPNNQPQTVIDTAAGYPDCFYFTDGDQACPLPDTFRVDHLDLDRQPAKIKTLEPPLINAEHIAAIAFTSGSTGKPTANTKHWRTLAGTAERLARRFTDKTAPPAILATVPSQHMYGLEMTVMMALQGRCSIYAGQPFYPQDIAAALAALPQPSLLVTTPVHLRALLGAGITMPGVSRVISATAPLAASLATAGETLFRAPVEEIYGCTEAGSAATRRTNLTEEWLLLDDMQLTQTGDGIEISGSHLSQPVVLQDRLEVLHNNRFRFFGRAGDVLNTAGKRASLAQLNQTLLDIEGVEDGVIFVPEGAANQAGRPAALVVSALSERDILTALGRQVDPVFLPRPLRKVASLPRSETGKLQHRVLNRLLSPELSAAPTRPAPSRLPVPREHPCYAAHFPGDPLVPGALLLQWILRRLKSLYPHIQVSGLRTVKFLDTVKPGDECLLNAEASADATTLRVQLLRNGSPVLKGILSTRTPAP